MVQLDAEEGAMAVHPLGNRGDPIDDVILVDPHLVASALAVASDVRSFGEDERRSTLGPGFEISPILLRHLAVFSAVVSFHRRGDDPVPQVEVADRDRLPEQQAPIELAHPDRAHLAEPTTRWTRSSARRTQ